MALGLVGAKEYASNIADLLNSENSYDRAGAAYGLGLLGARTHAKAIAKLQDDKDDAVRETARESLQMMGAANLIRKKRTGRLRQPPR